MIQKHIRQKTECHKKNQNCCLNSTISNECLNFSINNTVSSSKSQCSFISLLYLPKISKFLKSDNKLSTVSIVLREKKKPCTFANSNMPSRFQKQMPENLFGNKQLETVKEENLQNLELEILNAVVELSSLDEEIQNPISMEYNSLLHSSDHTVCSKPQIYVSHSGCEYYDRPDNTQTNVLGDENSESTHCFDDSTNTLEVVKGLARTIEFFSLETRTDKVKMNIYSNLSKDRTEDNDLSSMDNLEYYNKYDSPKVHEKIAKDKVNSTTMYEQNNPDICHFIKDCVHNLKVEETQKRISSIQSSINDIHMEMQIIKSKLNELTLLKDIHQPDSVDMVAPRKSTFIDDLLQNENENADTTDIFNVVNNENALSKITFNTLEHSKDSADHFAHVTKHEDLTIDVECHNKLHGSVSADVSSTLSTGTKNGQNKNTSHVLRDNDHNLSYLSNDKQNKVVRCQFLTNFSSNNLPSRTDPIDVGHKNIPNTSVFNIQKTGIKSYFLVIKKRHFEEGSFNKKRLTKYDENLMAFTNWDCLSSDISDSLFDITHIDESVTISKHGTNSTALNGNSNNTVIFRRGITHMKNHNYKIGESLSKEFDLSVPMATEVNDHSANNNNDIEKLDESVASSEGLSMCVSNGRLVLQDTFLKELAIENVHIGYLTTINTLFIDLRTMASFEEIYDLTYLNTRNDSPVRQKDCPWDVKRIGNKPNKFNFKANICNLKMGESLDEISDRNALSNKYVYDPLSEDIKNSLDSRSDDSTSINVNLDLSAILSTKNSPRLVILNETYSQSFIITEHSKDNSTNSLSIVGKNEKSYLKVKVHRNSLFQMVQSSRCHNFIAYACLLTESVSKENITLSSLQIGSDLCYVVCHPGLTAVMKSISQQQLSCDISQPLLPHYSSQSSGTIIELEIKQNLIGSNLFTELNSEIEDLDDLCHSFYKTNANELICDEINTRQILFLCLVTKNSVFETLTMNRIKISCFKNKVTHEKEHIPLSLSSRNIISPIKQSSVNERFVEITPTKNSNEIIRKIKIKLNQHKTPSQTIKSPKIDLHDLFGCPLSSEEYNWKSKSYPLKMSIPEIMGQQFCHICSHCGDQFLTINQLRHHTRNH